MSPSSSADVIVLGAGVIGTSIAFHLAQRRAGRIVLLDKNVVAAGGSGRSSALIRMHYSFPPEVQLALRSLEYFRNWEEFVGRPAHFRQIGFVRIVPEPEVPRLHAQVRMQQELGVHTRVIDRQELQELEPDWSVDDVPAAAYEPDSGYGDGAVVAGDFLDRARDLGVEYRPHTRAAALLTSAGRAVGVRTPEGQIAAPVIVAAVGPWSRPLLAGIGVDVPIEPEYHEVALLRNAPTMNKQGGCACIDSVTKTYFRSEGEGSTLVGAFYGERGVDPDDFSPVPDSEGVGKLVACVTRRVPALADAGIQRGLTGIYDVSPDSRPLLGEVPDISGLYVAAGFSGMGFKISPAIGLVMAELILEGRATTVEIDAFAPDRFALNRPIQADDQYEDD